MRTLWLIFYYGFARKLPKSTMPILGKWAQRLRNLCAHHLFAECTCDLNLEQGAYFGNGQDIHVLGGTSIGKDFICHQRIVTFKGGLMMGENVLFQGGGHSYKDSNKRLGDGPGLPKTPLVIEDDVWIGSRVIIAPGCKHIGTHSVIGVGAVVTHDVPDFVVVAGNPAKVIRQL